MAVTEGTWTCPEPECNETVVRSSLTDEATWAGQLFVMQRRHAKKHAAARSKQAAALTR